MAAWRCSGSIAVLFGCRVCFLSVSPRVFTATRQPRGVGLKSEYLSFYYALSATEIRLNLRHDDRVNGALREFECSNEFVRYRFMMNEFIERYVESHSISTDIVEHFRMLSQGEDCGSLLS